MYKQLLPDQEYIDLITTIFEIDVDSSQVIDIDELLNEKLLCHEEGYFNLKSFKILIDKLIPLSHIWQSDITGTTYQGFVDRKNMWAIAKMELPATDKENKNG